MTMLLFLGSAASGVTPDPDPDPDVTVASTAITGRSLVLGALKLIGVIAPGESPASEDLNDGLERLNELLDAWRIERLTVLSSTRTVYSLTTAAAYTVGPDGTFDQSWPMRIDQAGLVYTANSETVEVPLRPLTAREYATVQSKALTSVYPTAFYYNHAYSNGLGSITLWPVPDGTESISIALYTPAVISTFASPSTAYAFAPGYAKALRYNLALDLAPEYGVEPSAAVERTAASSKAWIKVNNYVPIPLTGDPALTGPGHWNINTGMTIR